MHSEDELLGTIPVWKLNGRPSASADRARLAQLRELLALSPLERVLGALELGAALPRPGDRPKTPEEPAPEVDDP